MTYVIKQLAQAALTPTPTPIYTAGAGVTTLVKDINVANTATVSVAVSLHIVPAGGTPSASNILFPALPIPPGGLLGWAGSQAIMPGSELIAYASAAGVCLTATGAEDQP